MPAADAMAVPEMVDDPTPETVDVPIAETMVGTRVLPTPEPVDVPLVDAVTL